MDSMWDYARESALKNIDIRMEETNNIQLDFNTVMKADSDIAGGVFSGAVTCHLVMIANKFFNKEEGYNGTDS